MLAVILFVSTIGFILMSVHGLLEILEFTDIIAAQMTKSYFQIAAKRAADHYDGKGMQDGIDIKSTISVD